MVNPRREDCALHQWAENFREQKIGDGFELIAGRGMSRDLQAELPQMLHRTPYFGAAGPQFLRNARSTDDHGGVVAQQANDAPEAGVGGAVRLDIHASWRCAGDKKIMREGEGFGQTKNISLGIIARIGAFDSGAPKARRFRSRGQKSSLNLEQRAPSRSRAKGLTQVEVVRSGIPFWDSIQTGDNFSACSRSTSAYNFINNRQISLRPSVTLPKRGRAVHDVF